MYGEAMKPTATLHCEVTSEGASEIIAKGIQPGIRKREGGNTPTFRARKGSSRVSGMGGSSR